MSSRRATAGFTLLEVLVAISIFALLGVASYRVLSSVMQTDERLAARSEELRRINRAFWVMQQDFEQIVPRNVRDGSNSLDANWLVLEPQAELPFRFTRGGRANPLGLQRSDMQRIAYVVDHHPDYEKEGSEHYHEEKLYLLRYVWPMLDGSSDKAQAVVQVMLADIERMEVAVQTNQGLMVEWPESAIGGGDTAPTISALHVTLQHPQWGEMERVYALF